MILNYLIVLNPKEDTLLTNRALCYIALNKQRNALNDLHTAIKINPRNVKAFSRLSLIQKYNGNLKVGYYTNTNNNFINKNQITQF